MIINVGVLVLNTHSTTVGTSYTTVSTYPGGEGTSSIFQFHQ